MKKQKSLFPLFMVMILLLSACSNASSGSHSGGAVIEDEPYEAVDYNLYPSPEGGYVGDVMPFVTVRAITRSINSARRIFVPTRITGWS